MRIKPGDTATAQMPSYSKFSLQTTFCHPYSITRGLSSCHYDLTHGQIFVWLGVACHFLLGLNVIALETSVFLCHLEVAPQSLPALIPGFMCSTLIHYQVLLLSACVFTAAHSRLESERHHNVSHVDSSHWFPQCLEHCKNSTDTY